MFTRDEAREKITELVANFRQHERALLKAPEAQIEDTYIRRLFSFLNWNTDNEGLSPAHYEFVLQRTDRKGKRPDYVLQLDGQEILVMDAKQPQYSMHDPRWMNQVYSYAYSTQNLQPRRRRDFAILTDFQEFVLLDCTLHVSDPRALTNLRILDWTCDDYVRQFDRLWELFERENVRAALKTRDRETRQGLWSLYLSPQKVKANRITPDKAFLAALDDEKNGWRIRLAKDMKKRNPHAGGELITAAVQLLINRLIFVKALSDREIEEDYLAQLAATVENSGLAEDDAGWFSACRGIFDKLNNFYNGSIFEPRPELEAVTVSNRVVRAVLRDLSPDHSPYNFAALPVEILGTIYERFLGRVVRATEKQVKIEDKPEVRKAGGVYYTPQYIVDYIVKHSVGSLLEKCRTPEDVAELRILDPACGSGSFLLGAYAELIRWHEAYYADRARLTRRDEVAVYRDADGRVRLTAKLKRDILRNNLYGVDIDPQAVEVTRFSLSLKALEDTRQSELAEERNLFHQSVLPDLSANIRCGNSLIGEDYFSGMLLPDPEEWKRVKPFEWRREFAAVFARGGFDAVIGNPPYVRQEGLGEFKAYFQQHFQTYAGTADLYTYFIEQGIRLLKENGRFGFIVANKWMRANYGEPLRRWLKQQDILEITDFGDLPVFEGATTYPCILIVTKSAASHETRVAQVKTLDFADLAEHVRSSQYELDQMKLDDNGWSLADEKSQMLLDKLMNSGVPLGDYVQGRIYRGILTGLNEAFVIDEATRTRLLAEDPASAELIKPFLLGRDIKRYEQPRSGRYLILIPRGWTRQQSRSGRNAWGWFKSHYPAIASHLEPFAAAAEKRYDKGEYWWELRACDYYAEFEKAKIIFPAIVQKASYAHDSEDFYSNDKTSIITHNDVYILGILNSAVSDFFLHRIASTKQGGFFEYKPMYVSKIPVYHITGNNSFDRTRHYQMVELVEQMLDLNRRKAAAATRAEQEALTRAIAATDRQIDALVYELYGLTDEEIRIVEGEN